MIVVVNHEIAPSSIAPTAANYAHAIASTSGSRWLHTSGIVPIAADGTVPASIDRQAAVVWSNLVALLHEADMDVADVVSITTYVVHGQPLAPVMAARDAALGGHRAASTLVTVPALARAEWLMEISLVAATDR